MILAAKHAANEWKEFVIQYGYQAYLHELAAVLDVPIKEIGRFKQYRACNKLDRRKEFDELFALWHGRQPTEDEWPVPLKYRDKYLWQTPELILLAAMVGSFSVNEIAEVLTTRLRAKTGDLNAKRNANAVQVAINSMGLQAKDVVGGITVTAAALEVGQSSIIYDAIRRGRLKTTRVGRLLVIPHDEWTRWKEERTAPPEGYVQLSKYREALAIKSDKLSEFARLGYIPTAVRCRPGGGNGRSTQFGTWYIDQAVVEKMVEDRRQGKPMPWHGKPIKENTSVTYNLWLERQHPEHCETCKQIWGDAGAPETREDYEKRYPPLAHGAKRHLTMKWDPGYTVRALAEQFGCAEALVNTAIENGVLHAQMIDKTQYISKTDAVRWKARRFPTGESTRSWLSIETAVKNYLFTPQELHALIDSGKFKSKTGTFGAANGVVYVLKQQCREYRDKNGLTKEASANRLGISLEQLETLLKGVNWREADGIPLSTFQAVQKRIASKAGYTLAEAAEKLGESEQWVQEQINLGVVKVCQANWEHDRPYLTDRMLAHLKDAQDNPVQREDFDEEEWLLQSAAAVEAGVTPTTILKWADAGDVPRMRSRVGWRYPRESVRAKAREYWKKTRFKRAEAPLWVIEEGIYAPRIA